MPQLFLVYLALPSLLLLYFMWRSRCWWRDRYLGAEQERRRLAIRVYKLERREALSLDEDSLWRRAQAQDPLAQRLLTQRLLEAADQARLPDDLPPGARSWEA